MKKTRLTQKKREDFIRILSETGNVSESAKAIGFSRTYVYAVRKKDEDFAKAWDEAEEIAADALEAEARRRAIKGTDKPVFHKGGICGYITEYSDLLLIALLRAHRPEKYDRKYSAFQIMETPGLAKLAEVLSAGPVKRDPNGS